RSGRPRLVRSENVKRVEESVREKSTTSNRKRSGQLGLSRTSQRRIFTNDLHSYPYEVPLVQEFKPLDYLRL
ncbi:hypothetical protein WH47_01982, partial [Habropoda laboriosa]